MVRLSDADIDRLYIASARYRGRMRKKIGRPATHDDRVLELRYIEHLNETAKQTALEPMRVLADAYISLCAELARIPRIDDRPAYNVLWNDYYTDGILKQLHDASKMVADDHESITQHARPLPANVQFALNSLNGEFHEAAAVWLTADGRLFLYSGGTIDHHLDVWTGPHAAEEIVAALAELLTRLEKEDAKAVAESEALEKHAKALAEAAGIKALRFYPHEEVSETTEWSQRMTYTITDAQALVDDGRATDLIDALRLMHVEAERHAEQEEAEQYAEQDAAVLDRLEALHNGRSSS